LASNAIVIFWPLRVHRHRACVGVGAAVFHLAVIVIGIGCVQVIL
jgi:hypothetical protein